MSNSKFFNFFKTPVATTLALIAGVLTLAIGLLTIITPTRSPLSYKGNKFHEINNTFQLQIDSLQQARIFYEKKLLETQEQYMTLHYKIDSLTENITKSNIKVSNDNKIRIQIRDIKTSIDNLNDKVNHLEQVIMEDPAKAMSLPLIKKDLNNLTEIYKAELLSTRNEISRVYDLSKWFIALMCTMAVGLLSLALNNVYQAKKDNKKLT